MKMVILRHPLFSLMWCFLGFKVWECIVLVAEQSERNPLLLLGCKAGQVISESVVVPLLSMSCASSSAMEVSQKGGAAWNRSFSVPEIFSQPWRAVKHHDFGDRTAVFSIRLSIQISLNVMNQAEQRVSLLLSLLRTVE